MTGTIDSRGRTRPVPPSRLVPVAAVVHIDLVATAFARTGRFLTHPTSWLGTDGSQLARLVNVGALMLPGALLAAWAILVPGWGRRLRLRLARIGVLLVGVGFVVAGAFPMPEPEHLASALTAEIAAALVLALLGLEILPDRPVLALVGFLLAALLVFDATTWALSTFVVPHAIHAYMGLQQRIATFGALVWVSVLAWPGERARKPDQR